MDWITGMQKAIAYIEQNLTQPLDYEEIARQSFSSSFHFQRTFSILFGITPGEYIRSRRLTLAGMELVSTNEKIIDIGGKYGYENPNSFTAAFTKFHGITPSAAREPGAQLRSFAPLKIKISLEGGQMMNYRIEEKPAMLLTGYKARFQGVPYGKDRADQEEQFTISTRAKQWLLMGACGRDFETFYNVINQVSDDGYNYYIAKPLDNWTRENLYNKEITGVDFMESMGFEDIAIPAQTYAVFETPRCNYPMGIYDELREQIVTDWLPNATYQFTDGPEIVVTHWYRGDRKKDRYVEIWLPIEKKA